MTRVALTVPQELSAAAPDLAVEGRSVQGDLNTSAGPVTVRLRRMAGRWLATAIGPRGESEVGADRSPYLAAQMALERWQPDIVTVMVSVGDLTRVSA